MEIMIDFVGAGGLMAVILALVGGTGSFLQSCRSKKLTITLFNFITELFLSMTTGLAIWYLGEWQQWNAALTNSLILVLTNNGGDTLAIAKDLIAKGITNKFNLRGNDNE